MPYSDVHVTSGSRRGNFIIFQCLPDHINRVVTFPVAFYWYLIQFPRHRKQTVDFIARKWRGEVNTVYIYHHSLPLPLTFDPRWSDAQFLSILRVLLQRATLQCNDIGIPTYFTKELEESIYPF